MPSTYWVAALAEEHPPIQQGLLVLTPMMQESRGPGRRPLHSSVACHIVCGMGRQFWFFRKPYADVILQSVDS